MPKRLLILSQVYVPDPAAVGQYLHDVAREWARRGVDVHVIASAWAHHDQTEHYPRGEVIDGVQVSRVPLGDLGKSSLTARIVGSFAFLAQALLHALRLGPFDDVLVTTSPPLAPGFGLLLSRLLGARLHFWVMDINPDQAVAVGAVDGASPFVRWMDRALVLTLRGASSVVVLDRFMRDRLLAKVNVEEKLEVIPPWPLAEHRGDAVNTAPNPFRAEHGLNDSFVVMYSGNVSATHPLDTLLDAAVRLRDHPRVVFVIVGDGTGLGVVERTLREHRGLRLRCLPYQPLERLHDSLSAADLHVVALGDEQVGIVHPSKVYGAMAVGRTFLYIGPELSHIGDIIRHHSIGYRVARGDADRAAQLIVRAAAMTRTDWALEGRRAHEVLKEHFDRDPLLASFCDRVG